jgi:Zn-dependent protease with chaperone function
MRRFLIGLAGGAALGYAWIRTREALAERREPGAVAAADPKAYGALRRALMLTGIARSLATLGFAAYAVGPLLETSADAPEPRARRLALLALGFAGSALLELPAEYVEGIALERRYGLSKQTDAAWLLDYGKSTAVTMAIGLPLIELLAFAVNRAPRTWPYLATAGSFPLLVLGSVVAPTFIAPLFNKFDPIEGAFADDIRTLAGRFGAGDATLLRVDMSRQTEKANAYVTGLFGTKRIVIGDTLLDRFEPRETLFVVAHELGHYVQGDVWRAVALGVVASAFVFFGSRSMSERPGHELGSAAGLARLFFAMSLLGTLAGPLTSAFSRSRERAADDFALEATHDAAAGAAAFRRLRESNLAEDEQPRWMELLFSSHPSLGSRIRHLETAPTTRSSLSTA